MARMKRRFITVLGRLVLVCAVVLLPAAAEEHKGPGAAGISKEVAEALLADARSRLPAGSPEPEIASTKATVWGDAALGCPRKDEVAAMRMTPGHRVLIRAGDQVMEYRVGDAGHFRLCAVGTRAPAPEGHPYPGPGIPRDDAPER
jgi:hypothetical protein